MWTELKRGMPHARAELEKITATPFASIWLGLRLVKRFTFMIRLTHF